MRAVQFWFEFASTYSYHAARVAGVFGAPTFIVDSEIFWGNDRMEEALEWHRKGAAGGNPSPF